MNPRRIRREGLDVAGQAGVVATPVATAAPAHTADRLRNTRRVIMSQSVLSTPSGSPSEKAPGSAAGSGQRSKDLSCVTNAAAVGLDHIEGVWGAALDGLFQDQMRLASELGQAPGETGMVDVAGLEGLGPDVVFRLTEMQLANAAGVEFEDIEEGDLGIAGAAVDPVGIEAKMNHGRVGTDHHVMELTGGLAKFGVVVMISQLEVELRERVAELVEGGGLTLELLVAFILLAAPADGAGVGDDDR
jgi:hypothetical protein